MISFKLWMMLTRWVRKKWETWAGRGKCTFRGNQILPDHSRNQWLHPYFSIFLLTKTEEREGMEWCEHYFYAASSFKKMRFSCLSICTFISVWNTLTLGVTDMNSTQDSKVGRTMKLMNPIWQLRMQVFSRSHMGLISMFLFLSSSPLDISNKEGNENAPASFYDSPCIKNSDRIR